MGGYIERISAEIADIILREGIDYTQTKAAEDDYRDACCQVHPVFATR